MFSEMETQNISPAKMSRLLNISSARLANWKARGSIPKEFEIPVANLLGVRVEWLKAGEEPKRPVHDIRYAEAELKRRELLASVAEAAEPGPVQCSPKARTLAQRIMEMSASGALDDARIDAIDTMLQPPSRYPAGIMAAAEKNLAKIEQEAGARFPEGVRQQKLEVMAERICAKLALIRNDDEEGDDGHQAVS